MKKKKILIAYATYGSGHKTVANYLYNYLLENSNYEIKLIDLMDYENIIGLISKKAFEQNFKHKISSFFFSIAYEFFDLKSTTLAYKIATKSIFKNKQLESVITSFNPDIFISTHFFGNIVISLLNKKNLTNAKIISIMTDYTPHQMWLKEEKSIDAIIVSNEILKNNLVTSGVNPSKIYPYGIPISESFSKIINKEELKIKYHITNSKKTFLFFAGGSIGSTFSLKYLKRILKEEYDINIIYICGKNEKLKRKAEKLIQDTNYKNIHILGFSKEVNNLLSISDVVITKPGGLSITECLEAKKPMLLIPGNGGNEIYNAKFVCKNGYGINCKTPRRLAKTINKILKRKHLLNNMKNKLNKYDNNKSIEKIFKLIKKM